MIVNKYVYEGEEHEGDCEGKWAGDCNQQPCCKVAGSNIIVRLLVATLHVGMTRKQDGGYTQSTQLQRDYLRWVNISFTHQ